MVIKGQGSQLIGTLAIFPLSVAGLLLLHAYRQGQGLSGFLGLGMLLLGVWTCFAQRLRFIDTQAGIFVAQSRWLWLRWHRTLPLNTFSHVGLVHDTTSIPGETSSDSYEVRLYVNGLAEEVFEIFTSREAAARRVRQIAQLTGLPLREDV